MFKYSVMEADSYDEFITDHEFTIMGMVTDAKHILEFALPYQNEDDHLLSVCTLVGAAILAGTSDITSLIDHTIEETQELFDIINAVFVRAILWSLAKKGFVTEHDDGTFSVSKDGMKALADARSNLIG